MKPKDIEYFVWFSNASKRPCFCSNAAAIAIKGHQGM